MSILELHRLGIIRFLNQRGLLSSSMLTYVEYYQRYRQERQNGSGYRESVRRLSREYGVSETTIKKAIRLIQDNTENTGLPTSGYASQPLQQSII
jgi:hypothetical protein